MHLAFSARTARGKEFKKVGSKGVVQTDNGKRESSVGCRSIRLRTPIANGGRKKKTIAKHEAIGEVTRKEKLDLGTSKGGGGGPGEGSKAGEKGGPVERR